MPASCGTRTAVAQLKASTFQVFLELHFFLFRARKTRFLLHFSSIELGRNLHHKRESWCCNFGSHYAFHFFFLTVSLARYFLRCFCLPRPLADANFIGERGKMCNGRRLSIRLNLKLRTKLKTKTRKVNFLIKLYFIYFLSLSGGKKSLLPL